MNSLPVKILTAIITFTIGVGVASLWLTSSGVAPVMDPAPTGTPAAKLEMVFVLDTTGSMGGLLDSAKQRIWGIVKYVTQLLPLTDDLDKVYTTLMDYRAGGGGDGPEDVRTALAEGLYKAGWSPARPDLAQIIFLVGDAPPHDDYDDEQDTLTTASKAVQKGIIVNTIQCGISGETGRAWQAIAARGNGQYFAIPADGGVQAITTPYDEQLGELATELGRTFTAYGFGALPDSEQRRVEVARGATTVETRVMFSAPEGAKAERALNKATNSKAYIGDLLQNIENGSLKLEDIPVADLPGDLQRLSPAERRQEIEGRLAKRREIRAQILNLSKERSSFVRAEQEKAGKAGGFDVVVSKTLKQQMSRTKF
jgi:hypothetical protein